ncbi:PDR/VanB family oxidoreductase [Geodermatophilus sp. CPCC 206100]|uniref:PDR/VanB family oxidoreductase n=1 Tax=Geodermatophilus sp. CPCC 206100 TaxID=3020054 RepID=UPI003B004981
MNEPDGVVEAEVVALQQEAAGVLSVVLADPERRLLPAWTPGAHIDLGLPDQVRQYSLCGDPADRRSYRIAVLREDRSGGGSRYVHETLRPGELVEVGGPRNHFALAAADEYVFVAGGIGITPLLPMIAAAERAGRPWRLTYGGRQRRSMAFLDELSAYGDRVALEPADERGLIDLPAAVGPPRPGVAVYCCGPEPLLAAVTAHCADWPPGALHVERFQARPRDEVDPADERAFEVVLRRSGLRVPVPADRSVLDAVDGAGVPVANACRDGVCGSCETPVLGGVPDHRDSVLPADAAGSMLICVSRARTDELVLDL